METVLADLQTWYAAQCDYDWEHRDGVKIETFDKGWMVTIRLTETLLEDKEFAPVKTGEAENSWLGCHVHNKQFIGYAGPHQLEQLLTIFLDWAKSEPDWLGVSYGKKAEVKAREDKELWAALGDEVGPELCRAANCQCLHVRHSAMCRVHHFEMIRGYRYEVEEIGAHD